MDPDLLQRVQRALGEHPVSPAERRMVIEAAERAQTWDALPDDVRELIRDIEARTFPTGLL
jgi:3-hydroxyacyl-CoA dehydrogenase